MQTAEVHIGQNIKLIRKLKDMSQFDVAEGLGMSQQDYSRLEERPTIDDETLEKVSRVLGFPVAAFKYQNLNQQMQMNIMQSGNNGPVNNYYNPLDALMEMHKEVVSQLKIVIEEKNKEIAALKAHLKRGGGKIAQDS